MRIAIPTTLMELDRSMPRCNGELRKTRLDAGLSQNRLARLADLDRGTVSKIERGEDCQELSITKYLKALNDNHLSTYGRQLTYGAIVKLEE